MKLHVPKMYISSHEKGHPPRDSQTWARKGYRLNRTLSSKCELAFLVILCDIYILYIKHMYNKFITKWLYNNIYTFYEKYSLIAALAFFALFSILSCIKHHQENSYDCTSLTSTQPHFIRHSGPNQITSLNASQLSKIAIKWNSCLYTFRECLHSVSCYMRDHWWGQSP